MNRIGVRLGAGSIVAATLAAGHPQQQIPAFRALGPIVSVSADSVQFPVSVRALSNGAVLVSEGSRGRVILFDSTLARMTVTVDPALPATSASLIPFVGDSTLYPDVASAAMLVLDERGMPTRTIAPPSVADLRRFPGGLAYWSPVIGARGGLTYKGVARRVPGSSPYGPAAAAAMAQAPDSAPLLRGDFETRTVDTVGRVKIDVVRTESIAPDATGNMIMKMLVSPLTYADDWLCLDDGTVAIVRAHDYHIDWIAPDGSRRSTPKISFPWRRLSDLEKQHLVDSLHPALAYMEARAPTTYGSAIATPDGVRRLKIQFGFIPVSEIPDYTPPFISGSMKEDRDGNVWIRTLLTTPTPGGYVYDVVNRGGALLERVQIPAGRILAGFGPRGAAILIHGTDGGAHLEIATTK